MQVNKGRVVVAMSGGVDSSVAAYLLKEQGYEVIGITMQIWPSGDPDEQGSCCSISAVRDAERVAHTLGIRHYVLNMRESFTRMVVDDFIREYREGRTPNPCVRCNQFVKFDVLMKKALALEADKLATGHYARVEYNNQTNRWLLKRAVDKTKDQSYALYTMTQDQLSHILFPLGEIASKEETRKIAEKLGLSVAHKPDSQEICFVPDNDYRRFLRENAPDAVKPGNFVDPNGNVVGKHDGVAFYTIGQRKGLGIAGPRPKYVLGIDPKRNIVVVGENEDLYKHRVHVKDVNLISMQSLPGCVVVSAKIRYNMQDLPGTACPLDDGSVELMFDKPVRAVTPGQSAVFYQDDTVVGGGKIAS